MERSRRSPPDGGDAGVPISLPTMELAPTVVAKNLSERAATAACSPSTIRAWNNATFG
jgi:hypothetical protein